MFEIVMGRDDFLIQLVKYWNKKNKEHLFLGRVRESLIKSEKQVYLPFLGKCRKSLGSTIFNNSRTRPIFILLSNSGNNPKKRPSPQPTFKIDAG
ncbi:hypothetical protein BGV40_09100 [Methanosarcina sp. Ant1]|nr:hypothetical protein BGV40_09100 [Methanosarcina sp. Ant1]